MDSKYKATEHETVLRDSGMFTQIQPEWLAESEGACDYVNNSRGVFVHVNRMRKDARLFYDCGEQTYRSSGWYTAEELSEWLFPVMRDDAKWKAFTAPDSNGDLTEHI